MIRQVERAYDVTSHGTDIRTVRLGITGFTAVLSVDQGELDASIEDMRLLLGALTADLERLANNGEEASDE